VRVSLFKQNVGMFDEQFFALFSAAWRKAPYGSGQEPVCQTTGGFAEATARRNRIWRGVEGSVGNGSSSKVPARVGQGLTREKLLELVIGAPSDARMRAYVSMARGGMDYQFFQLLTEKIDKHRDAKGKT